MRTSKIAEEQGRRLTKARKAAKFKKPKDATDRLGWNYYSYYDHETGRNKLNNQAAKYAKAFKVSAAWLLTGEGAEPEGPKIPVLGYAAGSMTGFNIIQDEAIDYFRCPPALEDIEGAYAIYVRGKSMNPQFSEGDLCFVHPHRQPVKGDTVIIQQTNNHEPPIAFIKTYLKQTDTKLFASQHNPEAEIQYPLNTILHIHKVLTMKELYGL